MMSKYFLFPLIFIYACQNANRADYEVKTELQLIDTLHNRLETVRTWLDKMPLNELQERKEIIAHNYDFCDAIYRERKLEVEETTVRLMDEYKTYGKMYKRASDSFKPIVMELEELLIQLKTLKESAHSKDYKKETFLVYFKKEKEDVLKLYKYAETVMKPTVETDLSFDRIQKEVEALAESLKSTEETK